MGRFDTTKAIINANIKTNGKQEISGQSLNNVLNEMVNSVDLRLKEVSEEIGEEITQQVGNAVAETNAALSAQETQTTTKINKLTNDLATHATQNTKDFDSIGKRVGALEEIHKTLDVTVAELVEKKVDAMDYAPHLTAGFADNLVGGDVLVDNEFTLRKSGNGAIADGVARIEMLKGNSVVWNQHWSQGVITGSLNNTDGTSAKHVNLGFTNHYTSAINGHKLMWMIVDKGNGLDQIYLNDNIQHDLRGGQIFIANTNQQTSSYLIGRVPAGVIAQYNVSIEFYDLTQMFGFGNEPNTIEDFYARIPKGVDLNAYNIGEIVDCKVDSIKSIGRNIWDEEWERGGFSSIGTPSNDNNRIRSKNFIGIPASTFYILAPDNTQINLYYYNKDKEFIYQESGIGNKTYTKLPNAEYVKFSYGSSVSPKTTYGKDICINLSDADFNGQYLPYEETMRIFPPIIKEAFPMGMRSVAVACDEVYNNLTKGVGVCMQRVKALKLKDFNWSKSSSSNNLFYTSSKVSGAAVPQNNNVLGNILSVAYSAVPREEVVLVDRAIALDLNGYIFIKDTRYSDESSLVESLGDSEFYYELAEPIVTEFTEPFNLDYAILNGGTEEAISEEASSALKADVRYGFNAAAKIKENANEIEFLKATIQQMQLMMASMVNVTNNNE